MYVNRVVGFIFPLQESRTAEICFLRKIKYFKNHGEIQIKTMNFTKFIHPKPFFCCLKKNSFLNL